MLESCQRYRVQESAGSAFMSLETFGQTNPHAEIL